MKKRLRHPIYDEEVFFNLWCVHLNEMSSFRADAVMVFLLSICPDKIIVESLLRSKACIARFTGRAPNSGS